MFHTLTITDSPNPQAPSPSDCCSFHIAVLQLSGIEGRLPSMSEVMDAINEANLVGGWKHVLVTLDLSGNRLTGSFPANILQAMIHLEHLSATGNAIEGELFDGTPNHPLTVLRLSSNRLSGRVPLTFFTQFSSLSILHLADNYLYGPLPTLDALDAPWLTEMDLSRNHLRSTLPPSWLCMPRLQTLVLQQTELLGPLPNTLNASMCQTGTTSISTLDVSSNVINTTFPLSYLLFFPYPQSTNYFALSLNVTNCSLYGSLPAFPQGFCDQTSSRLNHEFYLQVAFNRINGTIPLDWVCANRIKTLNLSHNLLTVCRYLNLGT